MIAESKWFLFVHNNKIVNILQCKINQILMFIKMFYSNYLAPIPIHFYISNINY